MIPLGWLWRAFFAIAKFFGRRNNLEEESHVLPRPDFRAGPATGTIEWYSPTKGYGFIRDDEDDPKRHASVLLYYSAVLPEEESRMAPGQRVRYERLFSGRNGVVAANCRLVAGEAP